MTPEDEEFNRIEREAKLRMEAVKAALDRKAENARELGLDYEPAQQEPVARSDAYDMIDRFLQNNLNSDSDYAEYSKALDSIYTTPAQRTWVGLTDEEKQEWIDAMPYEPEPRHCMILVNVIEAKLKEKNT